MKKILTAATVIMTLFLLNISYVFALGMTAGPVVILANVGSSNSSRFGLVNNGEEAITVSIRAEGDAAQFIEFPTTLDITPKKIEYVDIKATIPATYDGSLGGNITGFVYALQEGKPGQVQINVQAKKFVQLIVPQYGGRLPEPEAQTQTQEKTQKASAITGFLSIFSTNILASALVSAGILAFLLFFFFRRFDISIKPKKEVKS